MKENLKSSWETHVMIQWKRILKLREIQTQQFNERESWKCERYEHNNPMKENPKSAPDTNATIQWKRILKVHEMLI